MTGIANLTIDQFQNRICHFARVYVRDWNEWCVALQVQQDVPTKFGEILRRWQACRPNRMRRTQNEAKNNHEHKPPFLGDLIAQSKQYIQALEHFDLRHQSIFTGEVCRVLEQLWRIFQHLSYCGRARNGLAGVVGISKAVLLLTEGRIGPAFDSNVIGHLQIQKPQNALQWIDSLQKVSQDIWAFEEKNQCTLRTAIPWEFASLHSGRVYDMALGPREKSVFTPSRFR